MHVEPKDTLVELNAAAKAEKDARVRERIRAVILAKKGRMAKEIAEDLGVSPRSVQYWVHKYNEGGVKNLPDKPRSGPPRKCSPDHFEAVKKRIVDGPKPEDKVCTLRGRDVRKILEKEFGVVQTLSSTYNLMHTLELEPLRPRPQHRKNDPKAMKEWEDRAPFLSRKSATNTPTRRSRSGSRTKPGSGSKGR